MSELKARAGRGPAEHAHEGLEQIAVAVGDALQRLLAPLLEERIPGLPPRKLPEGYPPAGGLRSLAVKDIIQQRQGEPRVGVALRRYSALPIDFEVLAQTRDRNALAATCGAEQPCPGNNVSFRDLLFKLLQLFIPDALDIDLPADRASKPGKRCLIQARAVGWPLFLLEDRSREGKTGRYAAIAAVRLREERIDLEGGLEPGHGIWYRVSARKAIRKLRSPHYQEMSN